MGNLYGFSAEELKKANMSYTVNEISRQPKTWDSIYQKINQQREKISEFMNQFDNDIKIIFSGAGSSGFIGDSLAPIVKKDFRFKNVESIHTTDIVASPNQYLVKEQKTLIVSFGRSGNSPESVAAVELAEQLLDEVYHIIITCNKNGKLAGVCNARTLNLTFDEIEDMSFAMTSSVTGMMIAAYSVFGIENNYSDMIKILSNYAEKIIHEKYQIIFDVLDEKVDRLVVLGAGNLYGAAKESALKTTELTAGKIATRYDTPMGFRHGPKSFLDENTVILYFLSSNEYTQKYDLDMIQELSISKKHKLVVISDGYNKKISEKADVYIYNSEENILEEGFTSYTPILVAQIFSLKASLLNECTPDNPFPTGEVNRVVKGVTIHKY